MKVGAWLELWLETYVVPSKKPYTVSSYTNICQRYLIPHLGPLPISQLNSLQIQQFYNALRSDYKLNPKTIKNIHRVLHNALRQAVKLQMIRTRCVTCPAPSVMEYLREEQRWQEQMQALTGSAWDNPWNLVFTNELGRHLVHFTVYKRFKAVVKEIGMAKERFHDLRHPYVKHTTKKYYLQKQKSQATVSDNLGFLFLLYWNRSCTLYSISILPPGYNRTLSIRRSAKAVVSLVASASSFVMLFRWTCLSASSCSRFACAVNAA